MDAVEANRLHYARVAADYDRSEECVVDPRLRARLLRLLDEALALRPDTERVLDACGGSGNASLELLRRGHQPVTVDVSDAMLDLCRSKAAAAGFEADTVTAEISDFLAGSGPWDLIVFSSALHHLDDPAAVVEQAVGELAAGGVLLTVFDPVRVSGVGRQLRLLDYYLHILARHPRYLVRKAAAGGADEVGRVAERWAVEGLDDRAIVARARGAGAAVVRHDRIYAGRFSLTSSLFRLLRQPSSFSLLLVRSDVG